MRRTNLCLPHHPWFNDVPQTILCNPLVKYNPLIRSEVLRNFLFPQRLPHTPPTLTLTELLLFANPYLIQMHPYIQQIYPFIITTYRTLRASLYPAYLNFQTYIMPMILPFLDVVVELAQRMPVVTGIVVIAFTTWYIFFLMNLVQRMMAWGFRMVFTVVFWAAVLYGVLKVMERGPEEVVSWVQGAVDWFWKEYYRAKRERDWERERARAYSGY